MIARPIDEEDLWANHIEEHNTATVRESAETAGYAEKLTEIASELQGLSEHIKEYLTGEMATLPLLWDIQEVAINFERVTRLDA